MSTGDRWSRCCWRSVVALSVILLPVGCASRGDKSSQALMDAAARPTIAAVSYSVESDNSTSPSDGKVALAVDLAALEVEPAAPSNVQVVAEPFREVAEAESARAVPIDLSTALQIAAGQNPLVGYAQQRIQEAYAQHQLARLLWLPSIAAGVNYNKHDGVIQDVAGDMLNTSRSSVYAGLGSQLVGAGSPGMPGLLMNFHLRDYYYQPLITEQALAASRQAGRAATQDVLLEVAVGYTDLLEAMQLLSIAEETCHSAEQIAELTRAFADTGQGLVADAERLRAELTTRRLEVLRATEAVRIANIRLARTLSLRDHVGGLVPQELSLVPIEMVDAESELSQLIATGLSHRPELSQCRHLVCEAVHRLERERYAPLLPSVLLGTSYGGNGGSPTSRIIDFSDRLDFDAAVFWEVRQLGLGEKYSRSGSRAQLEQARWQQLMVMDRVAAEIAEAHAQVELRQSQIGWAEQGMAAADRSYQLNLQRIHNGQGLPLEVLQSVQALDQSRRLYVQAIADFNRSQFQLHRALGWPIQ